jgi:hypothetical protein
LFVSGVVMFFALGARLRVWSGSCEENTLLHLRSQSAPPSPLAGRQSTGNVHVLAVLQMRPPAAL